MSSEDELAEAVALAKATEPSVLRIQVFKRGEKPAAANPKPAAAPPAHNLPSVPAELAPLVSNIVSQLPALAQQLPEQREQCGRGRTEPVFYDGNNNYSLVNFRNLYAP